MHMLERVRTEPALVVGFVQAVIALVVTTGWLSEELAGAIMAVVAAGGAFVVRRQVTPTRKLVAQCHDPDPDE